MKTDNKIYKKYKLNNKGFSLLELLIVIAIMVVVSVSTMVGISVISKGNAKKVNKNLYSSLSYLKTTSMSKTGDWHMEIKKENGQYLIETYKTTTSKDAEGNEITNTALVDSYKCSASKISITYNPRQKDSASGVSSVNIADTSMIVKFSKSDGSCSELKAGEEVLTDSGKYGNNGEFVVKVKGSKKEYKTTLWYKTGRVTTEN